MVFRQIDRDGEKQFGMMCSFENNVFHHLIERKTKLIIGKYFYLQEDDFEHLLFL